MPYRPSLFLTASEHQLLEVVGETISAVTQVKMPGHYDILFHPNENQKFGFQWKRGDLEDSVYRQIEQNLRQQSVFNSYGGLVYSRKHNGIYVDLSGFTESPVHEEPPQEAGEEMVEMDHYISTEKYNAYEKFHPGYTSMMRRVVAETLKTLRKVDMPWEWRVLEFGSGPGELTERLGDTDRMRVTAVEYDSKGVGFLKWKIAKGDITNTNVVHGDFIEFARNQPDKSWAVVTSTFVDHHFGGPKKLPLHRNIDRIIKPDGHYILGEEFLPPHDETNPAERVTAHLEYNGTMIIGTAFESGCVEMPKLEFEAMVSGLRKTVEFIQQTVPDLAHENFRVRSLPFENKYNAEGIKVLDKLINRLSSLDLASLPNPEEHDENIIVEKRLDFIQKLRELREELIKSRCPGLQEDKSKGLVGGDHKMTLKQFLRYLNNAGMRAVGYFEGPEPVGEYSRELLNNKKPIKLDMNKDYPPGVWTLVASSLELGKKWGR